MGPQREKGAFSPADRPGSCKGLFSCPAASQPSPKITLIFLHYTASVPPSHIGDFIYIFTCNSFHILIRIRLYACILRILLSFALLKAKKTDIEKKETATQTWILHREPQITIKLMINLKFPAANDWCDVGWFLPAKLAENMSEF